MYCLCCCCCRLIDPFFRHAVYMHFLKQVHYFEDRVENVVVINTLYHTQCTSFDLLAIIICTTDHTLPGKATSGGRFSTSNYQALLTGRQGGRQTERQAERQTDRQTGRQAGNNTSFLYNMALVEMSQYYCSTCRRGRHHYCTITN